MEGYFTTSANVTLSGGIQLLRFSFGGGHAKL
jgi:hypothetical protein